MKARIFLEKIGAATLSFYIISAIFIYIIIHYKNGYNIFNSTYNVNWNKHQCLTSENNKKWNDKIIIHITPYRFMTTEAINKLKEEIKDNLGNCIFMSNEKTHYDYFVQQTSIKIEYYKPKDFQEVVTIIKK